MTVNKNVMASFGQETVQTQVISENNAVKYKLDFAASNKNSTTAAFCTLNDVAFGSQTFQTGLNTRLMSSTNALIESKYFDIKNASGAAQAFINYVNGLATNQVLLIISNTELSSTAEIDALFSSIGSSTWPGTYKLNKFPNSSYAAIYLTTEKCIAKEALFMNDGKVKEDSSAYMMVVFDKINDIGATGFSYKLVNDPVEYSSSSDYELKRYPNDNLSNPIQNIGVGSKIMTFGADLFADSQLIADGLTTRITLRWLKDQSVLSSTSFEIAMNQANAWVRKSSRVVIPDDADGYTIVATRYPQSSTSTGVGSVRNVFLTRVSRQFENLTRASEFGVNGIRMNDLYEESSDYILELVDTNVDSSGAVYGKEFTEFQRF